MEPDQGEQGTREECNCAQGELRKGRTECWAELGGEASAAPSATVVLALARNFTNFFRYLSYGGQCRDTIRTQHRTAIEVGHRCDFVTMV